MRDWLVPATLMKTRFSKYIFLSLTPFDVNDDETAGPKCSTTTTVT